MGLRGDVLRCGFLKGVRWLCWKKEESEADGLAVHYCAA